MNAFAGIAAFYRTAGPRRSILLFGGSIVAVAGHLFIFSRFANRIGWPEAYGFKCGRKCMVSHMWHSPKLIAGGSADELALFAVIWIVPAALAAYAVIFVGRRWLKQRRNRIRPLGRD